MLDLRIKSFVMQSGERYCLVVDRNTCIPTYAPNLFLTTQVRNASLSFSALCAQAAHLVVLYRFLWHEGIDLIARLKSHQFLHAQELDALRDFCAYRFKHWQVWATQMSISNVGDLVQLEERVSKDAQYARLSTAADYLSWLARYELDHLKEEPVALMTMVEGIRSRRPRYKDRNSGLIDKALQDNEVQALLEIIRIDSAMNPFSSLVRSRNRLIVLIEYELGIRGGELLNIRIEDFDFASNTLRIIRRADQVDDPRALQPLVKTRDRELVLSDWLLAEIHRYVLGERRRLPNASKCSYLFLTYKAGPTMGKPLSIASYKKVWSLLQNASPELKHVTGHRLRHTWNNRFSQSMDASEFSVSEAKQEAMRSLLMGWRPGSGTAARYNRRFIIRKAHEASLILQSAFKKNGDDNEQ